MHSIEEPDWLGRLNHFFLVRPNGTQRRIDNSISYCAAYRTRILNSFYNLPLLHLHLEQLIATATLLDQPPLLGAQMVDQNFGLYLKRRSPSYWESINITFRIVLLDIYPLHYALCQVKVTMRVILISFQKAKADTGDQNEQQIISVVDRHKLKPYENE